MAAPNGPVRRRFIGKSALVTDAASLVSGDASYANGATLVVDGGMMALNVGVVPFLLA